MHGSSVDFPPHFHILKVNILRSFWVITSFGKPRQVKKPEACRMKLEDIKKPEVRRAILETRNQNRNKMRTKGQSGIPDMYKCCFCCHVKTGTLFYGLLQLVYQIFQKNSSFVMMSLNNNGGKYFIFTRNSISQLTF